MKRCIKNWPKLSGMFVQGAAHIQKQLALIDELARDGHDTSSAKELLDVLRETQRMHEQDRDRIMREVATCN
jgi:hypothetical protein